MKLIEKASTVLKAQYASRTHALNRKVVVQADFYEKLCWNCDEIYDAHALSEEKSGESIYRARAAIVRQNIFSFVRQMRKVRF